MKRKRTHYSQFLYRRRYRSKSFNFLPGETVKKGGKVDHAIIGEYTSIYENV